MDDTSQIDRYGERYEKEGTDWNIEQLKIETDATRLAGHINALMDLDDVRAIQPILETWGRYEKGEIKITSGDQVDVRVLGNEFNMALGSITGKGGGLREERNTAYWTKWLKEHPPETWEELRALVGRGNTDERLFHGAYDMMEKGLEPNLESLKKEKQIDQLGAHARALSLLGGSKAADAILELLLKLEKRDWHDLKGDSYDRHELRSDLDWDLARMMGRDKKDIGVQGHRKTYAAWREWMKEHPPETWPSREEIMKIARTRSLTDNRGIRE